jgi:2-aminoadipate transaminase
MAALAPENTVLLGSFSKTVVPSFRVGWLVAHGELMEKLVVAKQAADLHTNYLGQRIIHQYLGDNDLDAHVARIRRAYGAQREAMVSALRTRLGKQASFTEPEGGMFLWVTLPEGTSSMELFEEAIARKVAFVPGAPFYVGREDTNTLRLNFSCVDETTIEEGVERLAGALEELLAAAG